MREAGLTHEQFAHDVRAAAVAWATDPGTSPEAESGRTLAAKLIYGAGDGRYRVVCHYSAWANGVGPVEVVEIAAAGEESLVQVAGTRLHELGHVLAGWGAGHGVEASLVEKPGRSRRYLVPAETARTITALCVLRDQVIGPILAGARVPRQGKPPKHGPASTRTTSAPRRHADPLRRSRATRSTRMAA